jgi:hypothetical protein
MSQNQPQDGPARLDEDETAHLNLSSHGFHDTIAVYRLKQIYERTVFSGPPIHREVWEYFIKDGRLVFERLRDRSETWSGPPEYEVVNNALLEVAYKEKQREWEERIGRNADGGEYLKKNPRYSDEKLAAIRKELLWKEVHGVLKYFILYCHLPNGSWWRDARELKDSFRKLESKAQNLGALPNDYGEYELPEHASPERKRELAYLFSRENLRPFYNTTYDEWVRREKLLRFLEERDVERRGNTK